MRSIASECRRVAHVLLGMGLVCALASVSLAQPWWNPEWQCRRTVELEAFTRNRPGEEAVFVEFPTGGHVQPDGRDIRVLAGDNPVASQVVFLGPGDRVSILFRPERGRTRYYVYYGNPNCAAEPTKWTPQRGLLLETRPYQGGECRNWQQMQDTLKRAGPPQGRGFVGTIFHGHNPFGPSRNFVSKYTGWLHVHRDGEWDLAVSSASAAFFFLDGERFLQWPGWHGPVRRGRFHRTVKLKAGLHRVAYYHVQGNADPFMVLVWRLPNEKRFRIIPPAAFLPPLKAKVIDYRLRENPHAPDFGWSNAAEATCDGRWFVTMKFADRPYGTVSGRRRLWDFGDGVTSTESAPSHVYLAPGAYTVTLSYPRSKRQDVCRQKVVVDRNWARQTSLKPEPLSAVAGKVRDYPLEKLSDPCLMGALLLYRKLEQTRHVFRAGGLLMEKPGEIPETDLCEVAVILGKAWRESKQDPAKAVEVYRKAEATLASEELRARVAIALGDTVFYDQNQPASARAEYERVVEKCAGATKHVRLAFLRLGDISRQLGKAEEARYFYRKSRALKGKLPAGRETLDIAMRVLETEDFLRRGLLENTRDSLYLWQWQDPEEKVRGKWSVLMIRYALEKGYTAEAVKEAEILLGVNPESQYAPEALWLLSEARTDKGQADLARQALARLKKDYPDSPLAKRADRELAKPVRKRGGGGGKRP